MDEEKRKVLLESLGKRREAVQQYLRSKADLYAGFLSVSHIRNAASLYVAHAGKFLRAQALLLACGIVGGREETAVPAAAALEAFHAWTLIHDDIIDEDLRRRGEPTLHEEYRRRAVDEWGLDDPEARLYGQTVGLLAGDILQGWVVPLLCELNREQGVDPGIVMALLEDLNLRVRSTLIDGQMMDVQFPRLPVDSLEQDAIEEMLYRKTGALYEFAGRAGAMIGLGVSDPDHPQVRALAAFAGRCGVSFQLQDDVLGVIGNPRRLGKTTGSDIRMGKRTLLSVYALKQAGEAPRRKLLRVFGNRQATDQEVEETKLLLGELGAVEHARTRARALLAEALRCLEVFPASRCRDLLSFWAECMIERDF